MVESDAVPFLGGVIPDELLSRLSAQELVIIGETHQLREHFEMMSALVRALHPHGFRQLLLEWPHTLDWLLADYVEDRGLEPDWRPVPLLGGVMIEAIRDFNRSLPEAERIQVRAIDVNLASYELGLFATSLGALARHLPDPLPVEAFLEDRSPTPSGQRARLEAFRGELLGRRTDLVASWGERWYDIVFEMVEAELVSVGVDAFRHDFYDLSVRLRENAMKRLADLRLEGSPHHTLVNVGGNHAQKERLNGTDQQWLGDYLVHESAAVGGSAVALFVTAARGVPGTGGSIADWDILDASPPNELFRIMNETWPEDVVYLPLDDPLFTSGGVPLNFEGTIRVCAPKRQYDGFVLLPWAHHVLTQ